MVGWLDVSGAGLAVLAVQVVLAVKELSLSAADDLCWGHVDVWHLADDSARLDCSRVVC